MNQQKSKPRVLIIPHSCIGNILIRARELAKHLTDEYDVYYLLWHRRTKNNLLGKIKEVLVNFFQKTTMESSEDGFHYVRMRRFYFPFGAATRWNTARLKKFVEKNDISIVINSAMMYYDTTTFKDVRVIYDVVDDLLEESGGLFPKYVEQKISRFCWRQIENTSTVLAVTQCLANILGKKLNKTIHYLPNGVNVERFQSVSAEKIQSFREQHKLTDSKVIGYIGNLRDSYTGLDFLLEFFRIARHRHPEVKLLLVGPLDAEHQKMIHQQPGVVWLGPLPSAMMPLVFSSIDIGVLPFELSSLTEHCLPIKILEYSAARKHVLATNLKSLRDLNMPNIHLLDRDIVAWNLALDEIINMPWENSYNNYVEQYHWNSVTGQLKTLMKGA
ncbi:MAG: glycosyltransferase family 4 protein [Gammaproteobacteria bacterium]